LHLALFEQPEEDCFFSSQFEIQNGFKSKGALEIEEKMVIFTGDLVLLMRADAKNLK